MSELGGHFADWRAVAYHVASVNSAAGRETGGDTTPGVQPGVVGPAVVVGRAVDELGVGALRLALAVAAALAATDTALSVFGPGAAWRVPEGLALLALALAGLGAPEYAARVLRPRGRIALLVALLAVLVALDGMHQRTFTIVAFPAIAIAAVVASPAWVVACMGISTLGYILGFILHGRSLAWVVAGPGESDFANELVDVCLWGGILLAAVSTLRGRVAGAPASLAAVRSGGESLTPELSAAVRREPRAMLGRADPAAVIAPLTSAERRVLEVLAAGRAPKVVARELGVQLPTVRTHIASAKRKTGARTLEQLVGLFVEGRDG